MAFASFVAGCADGAAQSPLSATTSALPRSQIRKHNSPTLAKRQQRAEVVTRYETSLRQFEAMLQTVIQLSLTGLCSAGASQAISVMGVLYLQMGFDSLLHGVGDGQVFIAALKRALLKTSQVIPGALLLVESVLTSIREALSKWRLLEPYGC